MMPTKEKVTMQLRFQVPEQLTGKSQQQLEALAFEALVVRLYALGELSSGEGAKLLSLTRREFLNLLSQYNVSLFDNEIDFKKEASQMQSQGRRFHPDLIAHLLEEAEE